ncbi:MAG: DUF2892 domain-containing protein [Caldiserica bacterium]|nr:DUF2892 domain-containing protein [Caldisericota bacterium]
MKQNESMTDRIIRVVAGVVFLALGLFSHANMTLRVVLDILGVIALFTGITGFCGLYALFHFSTKK